MSGPRTIAIAVFRDERDRILVGEGRDAAKGEVYHRPLGGGIELGERGAEALAREIREEIGAEICDVRALGVLENIFTLEGRPRHEIVLVYEARFVDAALYARDRVAVREEGWAAATWKPLADFESGRSILYPAGLLGLLGGGRP